MDVATKIAASKKEDFICKTHYIQFHRHKILEV